jgi:VWFA-related protein
MVKSSSGLSTTIASSIRRLSWVLLAAYLGSASLVRSQTAEIVGTPTIADEDQITVRIKASDEKGKPAMGLTEKDFKLTVDGKPLEFDYQDWQSPEETVPPPAWIVVLLDFSGSMKALDSKGTTKLEGAIGAIREFTKTLADRGPNTQVAIVPFGESSAKCAGFKVDNEALDRFFPASDFKLQNYLDFLAEQTACASTNLYEPVKLTHRFLTNWDDLRFTVPKDSDQPQPRLSIILLSDGYHTGLNEKKDFEELSSILQRKDQVIVHTLGYGLTPKQLGQKYKLGHDATRDDVADINDVKGKGKTKIPAEEFVDEKRLAEIAELTGGVHEFSGDSVAIADSLKLFLNALLGEYQITYTEPNPERGSKHDVSVTVQIPEAQPIVTDKEPYTMTVFGRSVPLPVRLGILGVVLVAIGAGGVLPFYLWAKSLKLREIQEN